MENKNEASGADRLAVANRLLSLISRAVGALGRAETKLTSGQPRDRGNQLLKPHQLSGRAQLASSLAPGDVAPCSGGDWPGKPFKRAS